MKAVEAAVAVEAVRAAVAYFSYYPKTDSPL